MNSTKRIIFPFGIFFILLIVFETMALSAVCGFFYYLVKQDTSRAEFTAREYLSPLLEVSAKCATIGEDKQVKDALNPLFGEYRSKGMVYKAFFVKADGTILAHSNPAEIDSLKNNIASDEFSYNLDQIFKPLKEENNGIMFSDYFIIENKVPFNKKKLTYIKRYISKDADRNGWLISRGVFRKNKPYGVVAFIIDKTPIYNSINSRLAGLALWSKRAAPSAALLALLISIIVYLRYLSVEKKTRIAATKNVSQQIDIVLPPGIAADDTAVRDENIKFSDEITLFVEEEEPEMRPPSVILDAIPIRKRAN